MDFSNTKCQLAMLSYEKENEIIKCRRYIKKLQTKLQSMGIIFKPKKK